MSGTRAPRPTPPGRLAIGRIGAPHGLGGSVHARLDYTGSQSLGEVDRVFLVFADGRERELEVRERKGHGASPLIAFRGIDSRDAAEGLRGAFIELDRARLPALAQGEYYLADLVGATVIAPSGEVGRVVSVTVNPSIDSLRIRLSDGREAEQALAPPWVVKVDAERGRVELSSLDGLIL